MAYPKTYKTDKGVYEIPEKEVSSFLKDFPNAMEVVSYKMGKDTFDIPVQETEVFLKENPQAVPLKKKSARVDFEGSSLEAGNALSGGVGGTEIPTVEMYSTPSGELVETDPVSLSKKFKQLSEAVKPVSDIEMGMSRGMAQPVIDEGKRKEAEKLKQDFPNIDFEGIYEDTKDLSDDLLDNYKRDILPDKETNNQLYQRKLSNIKWRSGIEKSLLDLVNRGGIKPDDYNNLKAQIDNLPITASQGDYTNQRDAIRSVSKSIQLFGGEKKDEILRNFAVEASKIYGNPFNKSDKTFKDTPESKYLNDDAQLGYQYLSDVDPEKAEQYKRLFIDKNLIKDDPDQKAGYDHLMLRLEETGIGLKQNAIDEEINSLKKIATEQGGLSETQIERAKKLEDAQAELTQKREELDRKYPERIENKVDDALQEIMGQKIGLGSYTAGKAWIGIRNTGQGIWEAVSSPFMSDQSNVLRELAIMGEGLEEEKVYHKTDRNKNVVYDEMVFQPDLQKQIDEIKNNGLLTNDQKEQKLYTLLKENTDKFGRVPIKGGKFNVSGSSIFYGLSDLGTSLLPFMALEYGTAGLGSIQAATFFKNILGNKGAKFLNTFTIAAATTFHNEYANAIAEGKPQSEAYKSAMASTAINSLAMAGAGTPTEIKAMANGKTSAGKLIQSMSDDAIQKVLDKGTPKGLKAIGQSFKERAKELPKQFAEGLKTGAKFEAYMAGANALNGREVDAKRSIMAIAEFGILGAGLGQIGFKSPTQLQKSAGLEFGKNPEGFKAIAEAMRKDGQLDEAQYNQRIELIDRYKEAYKTLPKADAKGNELTPKQKEDYLYNAVIKNEGNRGKSNLPPKQAEKAEMTAMVADHKNDLILEPKTDKQLQSRKEQLEKQLEKKDEEGKLELTDKERKNAEAELEAINQTIKEREDTTKSEEKLPKLTEPIEGTNEYGVSIGEDVPAETKPLTKEAEDLLASIGEGSKPTFITKNLERIAKENGIEVTDKMSADDVINALKEKQKQQSEQVGSVGGDVVDESNTKVGDVVYFNGQPVKIIEFRDSRQGGREAVIELPKLTKEQIHKQAIDILRNRYKEFDISDEDVIKYHRGDYLNQISALKQSDANSTNTTNVNFNELSQSLPTKEVKAEQPTVSENPALRDVESTAKALEGAELSKMPNVRWHGSKNRNLIFGKPKEGKVSKSNMQLDFGTHFTSEDYASFYEGDKGKKYPAIIDLKSPLDLTQGMWWKDDANFEKVYQLIKDLKLEKSYGSIDFNDKEGNRQSDIQGVSINAHKLTDLPPKRVSDALKKNGFDGIIYEPYHPQGGKYYEAKPKSFIVLDNSSIKEPTPKNIAEAYHKAKADGSNPELVKAVEDLLGKPKTQINETEIIKQGQNQGDAANIKPLDEKTITTKFKEIDHEAITDPYDNVLSYFGGNGKISPSSINELFGGKDSRIRQNVSTENEKRARISLIQKDAPTIDKLAHLLWEKDKTGNNTTQDYKDAIENVLLNYNSKSAMMKDLVERYDLDAAYQKYLSQHGEDFSNIYDGLTESEMNHILQMEAEKKSEEEISNYIDSLIELNESVTEPVTKPIPEVTETAKEQGVKEAVPEGTIETGRTEPEGTAAVLDADVKKAILDAAIDKKSEKGKQMAMEEEAAKYGKQGAKILSEIRGGEPPKPPTGEFKTVEDIGGQDLSGIRKALVSDKIIEGVDLERVSDKEMMSMGRKILDTGEIKPEALVEKIITDGKGVLTPTEVVGLITYKRDIDNALQDTYTKIAEKKAKGEDIGTLGVEAKNLERQIHDFDVMAVITAQQQSMAFRLRQRMLDREYNVVTQIEKYKANNNGKIPADVEAKFRELDKQLKDVKDKLIDAEKRLSEKEGQDAVNNIKESVEREKTYTEEELDKKINEGVEKEIAKLYEELPSDKKSAADKAIKALEKFREKIKGRTYESTLGIPMAIADLGAATAIRAIKVGKTVAEAVEIGINRIKKALKEKGIDTWEKESEYRKDLTTTLEEEGVSTKKKPKDKPVINEDGTVSIPNEMLRDLVKRGITDINDLTKAVHDQVKKDLPDISERQVRDYITDYGKKVNPTADEIQTQVNTAKRVGRLLSELEDLEKLSAIAFGVKYKKVKPTGSKLIEYERELKRKINTLSKDVFEKVEKTDEQKLADAKRRVKDRIDELNRKIKNKDFAKPAKKLQPTDNELVELNAEKERLQEEFDKEQYALELKNRNVWQKWEDRAYEATSGLMRGLTLGVDLSAAGVQGMRRLFTNPKESAIAFWDGLKFLISEKGANAYMDKQKAQQYYPLLRATKLAIDDKSGKQSVKEGMFVSEWINFIWNKAIAPVAGLGTKWGTDFVRKINPYAASQRAYDGYVNSIRIQTYLKLAKELSRDGYTYETDPKVFDKMADFVNTTTGRGSLGAADANSRWLNVFLTAPRKVISEVKLYTPYAFVYYARMPKAVRMKALKDFAQFTGTFLAVNALMWAARKNWDNDEDDDNFWNMNSSDFLTHKFGDKRVSIGGGMKSILTMQARFLTGKYTDQYGVTTKLGDRYGKPINTRLDLVTRFAIGKAAPVFNVLAKKLDERAGRPVENEELIKNISVPLWIQDVGDLYKNDPNSVAPLLMTLSILGANVRTVDKSKSQLQSEELSKEPIFKEYIDKGVNFPELNPEKIQTKEVNGKVIEKLSDYDTKIQEDFIKKKKEYLKQEFLKLKNGTIKVYVDNDGNATTTPSRNKKLKPFNQLTKEQIQNVISTSISGNVTEKVKKEVLKDKKPKK